VTGACTMTRGAAFGPPSQFCELTVSSPYRTRSALPAAGLFLFFNSRNAGIAEMLRSGMSWTAIQAVTGSSRATIAKISRGGR
jgi:hypothetical protein